MARSNDGRSTSRKKQKQPEPPIDTQETVRARSQHTRKDSTEPEPTTNTRPVYDPDEGPSTRGEVRYPSLRMSTRRSTLLMTDDILRVEPTRDCDHRQPDPNCEDCRTIDLTEAEELNSPEEFLASITQNPHGWLEIVREIIAKAAEQHAACEEFQMLHDGAVAGRLSEVEAHQATKKDVAHLRVELQCAREDLKRIRDHRAELKEERTELQRELQQTRAQLQAQPMRQHNRRDSTEGQPYSPRLLRRGEPLPDMNPPSNAGLRFSPHLEHISPAPRPTSHSTHATHGTHSSVAINNKYPDVPTFSAKEGSISFDEWEIKLYSFYRNRGYVDEWAKIDYARDHTSDDPFHIVRHRANPDGEDPYPTLQDFLKDLRDAYGIYDQKNEAETKLLNPSSLRQKDGEKFTDVFARFNKVIGPIRQSRSQLSWIMTLRSLLSQKLQNRLQTGHVFTSLQEFANAAREIERSFEISAASAPTTTARNAPKRARPGENQPKNAPNTKGQPFRPNDLFRKIRSAKLCSHCGEGGHHIGQDDRPCKNQPALSNDAIRSKLKAMGVAVTDVIDEEEEASSESDKDVDDGDSENEMSLT